MSVDETKKAVSEGYKPEEVCAEIPITITWDFNDDVPLKALQPIERTWHEDHEEHDLRIRSANNQI